MLVVKKAYRLDGPPDMKNKAAILWLTEDELKRLKNDLLIKSLREGHPYYITRIANMKPRFETAVKSDLIDIALVVLLILITAAFLFGINL